MSEFVPVGSTDDIPIGGCKRVVINNVPVAVVRLADGCFAVEDTCTHAEASLCDGQVAGDELVCPLHFATFNVRTGECTGPPAMEDLKCYDVRTNGESIEVATAPR